MAIRPQSEVDREVNEEAFTAALSEKAEEESAQEEERSLDLPMVEDEDFEVIIGEPEPEEEVKSDKESDSLDKLVDLLSNRTAPEPAPVIPKRATAAPVDREALRKKFNEKLHETDDPFSLVEESANALMGGTTAALSLEVQKLKREVLKNDPINQMVFENWDNEVETVIAALPANQQNHPDAYEYALKQVRNDHINEIIDAKVEERSAVKTRPGKTATLGRTAGTTTKRKTKKVYASANDKSEAKRYGLSLENYLKSRGKL